MSVEFENAVMQKLDLMCNDISELKTDVSGLKKDVTELKTDVSGLKKDVTELKTDVFGLKKDVAGLNKEVSVIKTNMTTIKKGLKEVQEDTKMLKNEVFNVVKPKLNSIEQKVDIMVNINTARILEGQIKNKKEQNRNHIELMEKIEEYEKANELEHSRLNYEICKLKVHA